MTSLLPFQLGLKLMGANFALSKKFREEIYNPRLGDAFNCRIQVTTRAEDAFLFIEFQDGKMRSGLGKCANPDLTLVYRNKDFMAKAISTSPDATLDLILTGDLYYVGNLNCLAKFAYLSSIFPKITKRPLSKAFAPQTNVTEEQAKVKKLEMLVVDHKIDNVQYLPDPYLGRYTMGDFPHLLYLKNQWFNFHPEVCSERARLVTEFFRQEGFETDKNGQSWHVGLRQGLMLKYVLSHKIPRIFEDDLLPGSTTSMQMGVQIFPEFGGGALWPELQSVASRELNPYKISPETVEILNKFVFPFWVKRNVRELVRSKYNNPLSQQLEEFFVFYFMWKVYAISHTIPNFSKILERGLSDLIKEIDSKITRSTDPKLNPFYSGLKAALEGVLIYSDHLRDEVARQISVLDQNPNTKNAQQIRELREIHKVLTRVPAQPAVTFREAITTVWIVWVCLHQENMNAGLSLGRLDQVLYPYFVNDMKSAPNSEEQEHRIRKMIDLIGAFYLKCQDHLPCSPNLGNKLFGGSSSDQAITLGGVTPEGENAVNDLTYIFLKVTEIVTLRDPNVNARYHSDKNSLEYLRRLCEVNINTTSTPSLHNDKMMVDVLTKHGFKPEDARNWGATGCVEPTSIGKHFGHTNCMMFNTVAPLEITMNNGYHPLVHPKIGLETGEFTNSTFPTFNSLLTAYRQQLSFMIQQSIEYNNHLGIIHQESHPSPLLSAIFDGPLEKGKDVVDGGAIYNSSGVAMVALVDTVDSLMALKTLVYDRKLLTLEAFKQAIDRDFKQPEDKIILEYIKKVPKFGSANREIDAFAQSLMDFIYAEFKKVKNYRGGQYFPGYWSMSNHVAFGILSGALPSGRLRGKAFTPGITPAPGSSDQLVQNIKSVASINPMLIPNNIAFNVKLVPTANDTHAETVDHFAGYAKSYFDLNGMQMQFNVVTTAMLRDAMVHPELYRWLMVRISGYNAYFVTLNRDMQIELIERMEFHA